MKSVFIIWKDIADDKWYPVAQLTRQKGVYRFNYTKGSNHQHFKRLPRMQDRTITYIANELFPFFKSRLLPSNKPEFKQMLNWSDIKLDNYDELDMLGIYGSAKKTDQYRIIPKLQVVNKNTYKLRFFTSGINYLNKKDIERINRLKSGEQLVFAYENANIDYSNAICVALNSKEKISLGYCPKYYNCKIKRLLDDPKLLKHSLKVVKTNPEAPAQFRLLCEFTTEWPEGFVPTISRDYEAYSSN